MMYSAVCFTLYLWILLHRGLAQLLDVNCGTVSYHDEHLISDSPWMALIVLPNKTCSGTLIHKQFVVTSANCLVDQKDSSSTLWLPSNITVRLGTSKIHKLKNIGDEYPPKNYNVQSAYIHSLYDKNNFNNDIALLELAEDVLYKAHIRPICIWLHDIDLEIYKTFTTNLWYVDKNENHLKSQINKITNFKPSKCINAFKMSPQNTTICAGYKNENIGMESGSPLINYIRHYNNTLSTLFGIQSYGELGTFLYTDVTSYIDWIVGIIIEVDVVVNYKDASFLDS